MFESRSIGIVVVVVVVVAAVAGLLFKTHRNANLSEPTRAEKDRKY
jgi:hypothetical protein